MNPNLYGLLTRTDAIMAGANGWHADPDLLSPNGFYRGTLHVGVDLGTAYTVLVVLDENYQPIAGEYKFAQVTRDGLVVDFVGAVDLLRGMKKSIETKLGFTLTSAACLIRLACRRRKSARRPMFCMAQVSNVLV